MTNTTTFDEILPAIKKQLERHAQGYPDGSWSIPHLQEIIINRDLYGRVRLLVDEDAENNTEARQVLDAIAQELSECLGHHAYATEGMVLYEPNLQAIKECSFPLSGFRNVWVMERLATETNWSTLAPVSQGKPRIVFFSIKGGVGRSTALAISAWHLAQQGMRVLVLDLDLESPGLSSALLPPNRQPTYGITDWLVEDLVGNGDTVFNDMVATSNLSHDGEIFVVPAHGREPGEYIAKLARVWMPTINAHGQRQKWPQRLNRLVDTLEKKLKPDVILIDSRAGIDEVASACITDLGASDILLFALEGEQTWTGYSILFEHWLNADVEVVRSIRERLHLVGAMLPELGRSEYFAALNERASDVFREHLYDDIPAQSDEGPELQAQGIDPFNFDEKDTDAPHYPWPIDWHRSLAGLRSLHQHLDGLNGNQVKAIFGEFLEKLETIAQVDEPPNA